MVRYMVGTDCQDPDAGLELCPATESDIPFLVDLRERTMRGHVEATGVTYDGTEQLQRVLHCFGDAMIIRQEGRNVGLLKLSRATARWELIQIQITPELQGRGIGRRILGMVLADAKAANMQVGLQVFKTNPARHLYARCGFQIIGEGDHGYVMLAMPT